MQNVVALLAMAIYETLEFKLRLNIGTAEFDLEGKHGSHIIVHNQISFQMFEESLQVQYDLFQPDEARVRPAGRALEPTGEKECERSWGVLLSGPVSHAVTGSSMRAKTWDDAGLTGRLPRGR